MTDPTNIFPFNEDFPDDNGKYPVKSKNTKRRPALARQKRHNRDVINLSEAREYSPKISRRRDVELIPRNTAQEIYTGHLLDRNNRITFALGPAGTGKTLLAVLRAIQALKSGEISRILVTRPAVSVDEQHGFLPGTLNQKMEPWTRPIFDIFEEYWSPREIANMLEDRIIEICPLAYMRGRTFKNCFIVADEMQNSTPEQMKMLLTRPGIGSFMAVTGDANQHDRGFEKNGLLDFVNRLTESKKGISVCQFSKNHVERDPIVQTILDIYGED